MTVRMSLKLKSSFVLAVLSEKAGSEAGTLLQQDSMGPPVHFSDAFLCSRGMQSYPYPPCQSSLYIWLVCASDLAAELNLYTKTPVASQNCHWDGTMWLSRRTGSKACLSQQG